MADSPATLYAQASELARIKNYEPAYQLLQQALRIDPAFHPAWFMLSRIACDFKNVVKEIDMLLRAVACAPSQPEYWAHLARAYAVKGDVNAALDTIEKTSAIAQQTALSLDALGGAYNRLSLYQQAAECFAQALQQEQGNPAMYFNFASTLKFCGRFDEARTAYEKAIALHPNYYKAHAALTSLGGISAQANHIARLSSLYEGAANSDDRLYIAHALAKELECLGDYEQAWHYLHQAKTAKRAQWNFSLADDLNTFAALKQFFSQASPHSQTTTNEVKKAVASEQDTTQAKPIFVVGMPRSGTTLVERILSNHQQVATAGELPTFGLIVKALLNSKSARLIDATIVSQSHQLPWAILAQHYLNSTAHHYGQCQYLVDKLPLNGLYAGHIMRALPQAKVICLDRDLFDTAMSNYRQLFSFAEQTYGYSLSLEDCLRFTLEFKRLAEYWQQQFPQQFYLINYERLVSNPAAETQKLFAFCGLAYTPDCLDIAANKNPVATASSVQVRGPISASSVKQWRHYEPQLQAAYASVQMLQP